MREKLEPEQRAKFGEWEPSKFMRSKTLRGRVSHYLMPCLRFSFFCDNLSECYTFGSLSDGLFHFIEFRSHGVSSSFKASV